MKQAVYYASEPGGEIAFTVPPQSLKFGAGSLSEIGEDARSLDIRRAALFVDRHVAETPPAEIVRSALTSAGVDVAVYDDVLCEPTDRSFLDAAAFARDGIQIAANIFDT